jgi:hypothetical protein
MKEDRVKLPGLAFLGGHGHQGNCLYHLNYKTLLTVCQALL